jgi:hypothetical protein
MQYRSYSADNKKDLLAYKKEVGASATLFISDLSAGKYQFTISDTERATVESTVLSYQQDLVRVAKYYIERAKNNDIRETGDMHFTLRSTKMNISINVDPYRIVQSRDKKNMEVDVRITMNASGSEVWEEMSASIEGNITIIGSDLYVRLRDYSIKTSANDDRLTEMRQMLDSMKWKTYHQKLDDEALAAMQESQGSYDMIDKLLAILDREALFTPVAKQGSEYILMFRKSTAKAIAGLGAQPNLADINMRDLMIPIDIRMIGTKIQFHGYADNVVLDATVDRSNTGTPTITMNMQERGTSDMWHYQISRTPSFWALAAASREYTVDARATDYGATATVKKGTKTLATAKIDSTGLNAWSYDLSAVWDYVQMNWDTEEEETESIVLHFWGKFRDEFGTFTLVPPTLYEEMSKLQKQLEDL